MVHCEISNNQVIYTNGDLKIGMCKAKYIFTLIAYLGFNI